MLECRKKKEIKKTRLQEFVNTFRDTFKTDGHVLFCIICDKGIVAEKKSQVTQHINSAKHKVLENRRIEKKNKDQSFIKEALSLPKTSRFCEDLCLAFISADIPLSKLEQPNLSSFIEKYTQHKIPCESTLRKNYVAPLYDRQMETIKSALRGNFLWISIDETTDVKGRFIANVIIGILHHDENKAKQKFLLNIGELEKTNHTTIARLFDDSFKLLGKDFDRDAVLLFLTDAAPYMVKAADAIKVFYPKALHLTCLAHGLHRVAEQIRALFSKVDLLISNVKKIFLKAPTRIDLFKEMEPNLALPPQPVLTRWGTWLDAAVYYANNFEKIKNIVNKFDAEEAFAISCAQNLFSEDTVKDELAYILTYYEFLSNCITKLETFGLSLIEGISIVDEVSSKLACAPGDKGTAVNRKLEFILRKNKRLQTIKSIARTLSCQGTSVQIYSPAELAAFKYAPITSVDVERSFSMYKNILRSNRQNFLLENLQKICVINCNQAFTNNL